MCKTDCDLSSDEPHRPPTIGSVNETKLRIIKSHRSFEGLVRSRSAAVEKLRVSLEKGKTRRPMQN